MPSLQDFISNINKPLPDDASSLTPSQSASQLEPDVDLHIPPAHAIADLGLPTSTPHVLSRRITEEELGGGSSSSDEDEVEVVDNPRFGARSSKQKDAPAVSARRDESPSKSRFFGSIRGLFGHTKKASSISGDPEDSRAEEKPPKPRKVKTWDTRTDKNLRKAEPIVVAGSPSASALDVSTPRARRLRKDSPDKRQRRRSASVDGAFATPETSSSAVPKRKSTKKKRLAGETSPSSGLSRNSSITSAPATFSARAISPAPPLPAVDRAPSHKRQLSLITHTPVSTRTERRVSSPSVQGHSLMSIVEGVARVNRQATSENDRGRERTLSGGLVSVKAPQSFSKKEIDGLPLENFLPGARERTTSSSKSKAHKITTLFDVKAPASSIREHIEGFPAGSVLLASSSTAHSAPSQHASKSASHAPVASPSNAAASPSSGSSQPAPSSSSPFPRPPLRSALRNGGSRTPSPMSSAGRAPSPVKGLLVVQAPSPLHAVATTASTPQVIQTQSFSPPVQTKSTSPIPSSLLEDDDDNASVSSYETTHEMFDDAQDEATPKPAPASPAPPPPDKEYIILSPPAPNGAVHIQSGTDVSISSDSTVNNGTPKRRKSVRVSLRPTFSPTPPAIEYEEWRPSENTVIGQTEAESSGGKRNGWKDGEPPDMWQDSSDEDEEYSTARRLLNRVAKKEKKARGG